VKHWRAITWLIVFWSLFWLLIAAFFFVGAIIPWLFGFLVLLVIWQTTKSKRTCPVCGHEVKKGLTVCGECGHDFRIAAQQGAIQPPT
jgi:hypothetical protein